MFYIFLPSTSEINFRLFNIITLPTSKYALLAEYYWLLALAFNSALNIKGLRLVGSTINLPQDAYQLKNFLLYLRFPLLKNLKLRASLLSINRVLLIFLNTHRVNLVEFELHIQNSDFSNVKYSYICDVVEAYPNIDFSIIKFNRYPVGQSLDIPSFLQPIGRSIGIISSYQQHLFERTDIGDDSYNINYYYYQHEPQEYKIIIK